MKAILLSAGYGTRLRPLTEMTPKPMLKVMGVPILDYTLNLLSNSGINEVLINRHHCPDGFNSLSVPDGMRVRYSTEESILGTLGGVLSFKEDIMGSPDDDFLVINGDIIFDLDIDSLIERHKRKKNIASMVLCDTSLDKNATPLYTDTFSNVVHIGLGGDAELYQKHIFSGIQLINKSFFDFDFKRSTPPLCLVRDFYIPYIASGRHINSFIMKDEDVWVEIGTPSKYLSVNLWVLKQLYDYKLNLNLEEFLFSRLQTVLNLEGIWFMENIQVDSTSTIIPPVFVGRNSVLGPNSVVGPWAIVGDDVIVEEGVHIKESLLLDGAKAEVSSKLNRNILGPGFCLNV